MTGFENIMGEAAKAWGLRLLRGAVAAAILWVLLPSSCVPFLVTTALVAGSVLMFGVVAILFAVLLSIVKEKINGWFQGG